MHCRQIISDCEINLPQFLVSGGFDEIHLIWHPNDWHQSCSFQECFLFSISMLSHKRGYAGVLWYSTTSQPYTFLDILSVRSDHIDWVAYRPSHYERLAGEEDISRRLGSSDKRLVMLCDNRQYIVQTMAYLGYTDPSVGEDSPTYA